MSKTKPPPSQNGPVITDLLNLEQIQLLAKLLTEFIGETGHGKVQIVISDQRVKHLRSEKSY